MELKLHIIEVNNVFRIKPLYDFELIICPTKGVVPKDKKSAFEYSIIHNLISINPVLWDLFCSEYDSEDSAILAMDLMVMTFDHRMAVENRENGVITFGELTSLINTALWLDVYEQPLDEKSYKLVNDSLDRFCELLLWYSDGKLLPIEEQEK